jgi:hypothetical protein
LSGRLAIWVRFKTTACAWEDGFERDIDHHDRSWKSFHSSRLMSYPALGHTCIHPEFTSREATVPTFFEKSDEKILLFLPDLRLQNGIDQIFFISDFPERRL